MTDPADDADRVIQIEDDNPESLAGEGVSFDPESDDSEPAGDAQ